MSDFSPLGAQVAIERVLRDNEHLQGCDFEIIK